MARQANKVGGKSSVPKRRAPARRKKKGGDRAIFIGAGLIAALLLLVTFSIMSIKSDKTGDKSSPVQITEKVVKPQVKTPPANEKTPVDSKTSAADDISAIIRLVLFDYEISRSSVEERISVATGGNTSYYFTVKCHGETIKDVTEALRSVLGKQGYKLKLTENKIAATGNKDAVQVTFISTDIPEQTAKTSTNKPTAINGKTKPVKVEEPVTALPTPPEPADVVVKMAILLDDGGSNLGLVERFVKLKYPVGIAILPFLQYSTESARLAYSYRKTVFLHFPMQPQSYPSTDPGKGAILISLPEILVEGVVKENFESLGVPVDGFNNHMGSAVTEDAVKMAQVMKASKKYTDIFVDSRTTAKSVAYDECEKAGLLCGINKRFIDNDNDVNLIITRLYEAAELAKKHGEILVIGHVRPKTLEALEIALPILESRKIAIVPIKTVVR